jgi:hypothetical protein
MLLVKEESKARGSEYFRVMAFRIRITFLLQSSFEWDEKKFQMS